MRIIETKFLMVLTFSPTSTTSQHHRHFKLFSSFLTFFRPSLPRWAHHIRMEPCTTTAAASPTTRRRPRRIVVIMGPTGAGKSRLSIDLATRFFNNSEIINCDKMQVYRGLDITTNKITTQDRLGVPHHLLGAFDPTQSVVTPSDFRKLAAETISDIKSRWRLPLIVGGSNSFIYSLVAKRYDPKSDVFNGQDPHPYLSKRVDEMLDSGMYQELEDFFREGRHLTVNRAGLGQAIGVPEFEAHFTNFLGRRRAGTDSEEDVMGQAEVYDEAVRRIKDNTCQLAKRQGAKILRLRDAGWELKRIDATEAFRAVMTADPGGGRVAEIWEKQVVEPSVKIVKQFLNE